MDRVYAYPSFRKDGHMKKYKKIIVIAVMLISIISMTVCVNASVGKVNGIKKNVKVSTYKGWVSAKDTKMRKIKYNQGVKISWKKIKNSSGYEVYAYFNASKQWRKIKFTKKTSYLLTNVLSKDKVKIKIRAYKKSDAGYEYGKFSKSVSIKTKCYTKMYKNAQIKPFYDRYAAENAFVQQNKVRASVGASKLEWSEDLYNICYIRAKEIAKDFSHDKFESTSLKYFKKTYGVNDLWYETKEIDEDGIETSNGVMIVNGENIATGQADYLEAITSWKHSKGHYLNMINKSHVVGAIGCYKSKNSVYWVAIFSDNDLDKLMKTEYWK